MKEGILIIGKNGQIASAIRENFLNKKIKFSQFSSKDLDITNKKEIEKTISKNLPKIVINCSAFTNVELAETERDKTKKINSSSLYFLSEICRKFNVHLIHFSTDYVFGGDKKIPYEEDDMINPLNYYGKTKLEGEEKIRTSGCWHTIIRTSWVYSEFSNNFLKTILSLASNNKDIRVIDDQLGSPTSAHEVANIVAEIICCKKFKLTNKDTYNFSGNKTLSWFQFAKLIIDIAKQKELIGEVEIIPIKSKHFTYKAERPKFSSLSSKKLGNFIQYEWSEIDQNIEIILEAIKGKA